MTIRELFEATGMTQKAFSEFVHIPLRTIEDWIKERRTPPPYMSHLIEYKLRGEGIIK